MNVKLLRKVQAHILAEPKRLDMRYIHTPQEKRVAEPPCGTVCCIAGWAISLKYKSAVPSDGTLLAVKGESMGASDAEEILEMNNMSLFFVHEWPEKFRKAHEAAATARGRARAAYNAINDYIKTDGWHA